MNNDTSQSSRATPGGIMTKRVSQNWNLVADMRSQNPTMKAIDIAERLDITRGYVRLILLGLGLPTRFDTLKKRCEVCSVELGRNNKSGLCCQHSWENFRVHLTCDNCGKTFWRRKKEMNLKRHRNQQFYFCRRDCTNAKLGPWLGVTYGFRSPNETERQKRVLKKRDFCKRGHLLSGSNLYSWGNGRWCRACRRRRDYTRRHDKNRNLGSSLPQALYLAPSQTQHVTLTPGSLALAEKETQWVT